MEVVSFWNDLSWVLDLRTPFLNIFFDLYPVSINIFLKKYLL